MSARDQSRRTVRRVALASVVTSTRTALTPQAAACWL